VQISASLKTAFYVLVVVTSVHVFYANTGLLPLTSIQCLNVIDNNYMVYFYFHTALCGLSLKDM